MLYHYLINGDRLTIGKFNSIACGAKFLFTSANHALGALSTYMFPIFFEKWDLPRGEASAAFRWGRVRADYEHFIRNPRDLSVFFCENQNVKVFDGLLTGKKEHAIISDIFRTRGR